MGLAPGVLALAPLGARAGDRKPPKSPYVCPNSGDLGGFLSRALAPQPQGSKWAWPPEPWPLLPSAPAPAAENQWSVGAYGEVAIWNMWSNGIRRWLEAEHG